MNENHGSGLVSNISSSFIVQKLLFMLTTALKHTLYIDLNVSTKIIVDEDKKFVSFFAEVIGQLLAKILLI